MSIKAKPFNHADLRGLLMIEWVNQAQKGIWWILVYKFHSQN